MEKLEALIAELERNIANMNVENQAVSKSPVGWHIDHALLTINKNTNGNLVFRRSLYLPSTKYQEGAPKHLNQCSRKCPLQKNL
jgi:hypothetical protein